MVTVERITALARSNDWIVGRIAAPDSWQRPRAGWWARLWPCDVFDEGGPWDLDVEVVIANEDPAVDREVLACGFSLYCEEMPLLELMAWARRIGFEEATPDDANRVERGLLRPAAARLLDEAAGRPRGDGADGEARPPDAGRVLAEAWAGLAWWPDRGRVVALARPAPGCPAGPGWYAHVERRHDPWQLQDAWTLELRNQEFGALVAATNDGVNLTPMFVTHAWCAWARQVGLTFLRPAEEAAVRTGLFADIDRAWNENQRLARPWRHRAADQLRAALSLGARRWFSME